MPDTTHTETTEQPFVYITDAELDALNLARVALGAIEARARDHAANDFNAGVVMVAARNAESAIGDAIGDASEWGEQKMTRDQEHPSHDYRAMLAARLTEPAADDAPEPTPPGRYAVVATCGSFYAWGADDALALDDVTILEWHNDWQAARAAVTDYRRGAKVVGS